MNAEAAWLFLSIVISAVGFALFVYGKKQARLPQLLVGILMSGFPYFIPGLWWMLGIAVGLIALLWVAVRMGW